MSASVVALAAAGSASAAVWLSGPRPSGPGELKALVPLSSTGSAAPLREGRRSRRIIAGLVVAGSVLVTAPTGWSLVLGGGAVLIWLAGQVLTRRRAARAAAELERSIVEGCEHVAADVVAGLPAATALAAAGRRWPIWEEVAGAERVGADPARAMRVLSQQPGGTAFRAVAGAWQVSARTGSGLAAALDATAIDLREAIRLQGVIDGELASARATAKLMAALPVAALAMGAGVGGDPWSFLFATPIGWACLGSGATLAGAGIWWIDAIARQARGFRG